MRQIFLLEYTRFFENRGFIHLKDERSTESQNSKSGQQSYHLSFADTHHFIKWIQQDGFLYITINIEEIFMHIKLGYCTRYRLASRAFLNEMIKFFALEFHVHSFTYDYHLTAINRNFLAAFGTSNQISQTISKFLDEFVKFFHCVPLFSTNKVFKIVYEKLDCSLIPHKFGLIFDFMITAKKKINKDGKFNISFTPLCLNLVDNIGIYLISKSVSQQDSNKQQKSNINRVDYSKYLVIKIESYQSNSNSSNNTTVNSSSTIKKKFQTQLSVPDNSSLHHNTSKQNNSLASSRTLLKASNNSSTSSFIQLANQSDGALLLNQNLQKVQASKQQSDNTPQKPTNQGPQQSYIRLVCDYLCINKNQYYTMDAPVLDPSLHKKADADLKEDLLFLDKMIEESISVYKQEIFWDNLVISMTSLSSLLSDEKSHMPIVFAIQSEELEQILETSEKIDALKLDPNLNIFLRQCFTIKDKIRSYFEFHFGRHFIHTSSEMYDYCLLLINDDLINKFGCSSSSSIKPTVTNERRDSCPNTSHPSSPQKNEKHLDSFVLLKFNLGEKNTDLWQVNRVKGSAKVPESKFQQKDMTSSEMPKASKSEKLHVAANLEKVTGSNKYLSFVVNNLMHVLWESLFTQN